jgi:putative DNA primase/helicase
MEDISTKKFFPQPQYFGDKGKILHDAIAHDVREGVAYAPNGVLARYVHGKYVIDPYVVQNRVNDILRPSHNIAPIHTNKVMHDLEGTLPRLSYEQPPEGLINLENGLYNYNRNTLEPHSPELATLIQLPIWYNPEATCPIFDDFIAKIIPQTNTEDNLKLIWEVIAYLLLHGNPMQRAVLFYGNGSNGKSSFINIMEHLVGKQNCSNITLTQMSRIFEPAELLGKQLNTVGDLDLQFLQETESFKRLTGGDPITAQMKNKDPFTFVNWAVPLFATNNLWKSRDLSPGYFRRWLIIPFPNKISKADFPHTFQAMVSEDEKAGIFNKAMQHLPDLLKRGEFIETPETRAIKSQFMHESDNVSVWLEDDERILQAHPKPDDISLHAYKKDTPYTKRSYVARMFKEWCHTNDYKVSSSGTLYKRLEALGYELGLKDNNRVVFGITFRDNHDQRTF